MTTHLRHNHTHNPQILQVYLYYRLVAGAILYILFIARVNTNVLGIHSPELFKWTSLGYTAICLASLFIFKPNELRHSLNRITLLLVIDLIATLLMIHASGGVESGLGYLLLVSTAMASIFIRGQLSIAFAALISLFVIGETLYIASTSHSYTKSLFSAGFLGILVFATAFAFQYLTEKVRLSDEEAAAHAQHAQQLQRLARHIVTRMRTGIIVINEKNQVELINQSALQLLDLPSTTDYLKYSLSSLANLQDIVEAWRINPIIGIPNHHQLPGGQEIRISFASLDTEDQNKIILYLEDYRSLAQHAQQLKLASLGRLTASIAHEVRNPLGAISHAAQLLSESEYIHTSDERLTEIIQQHSIRVNHIIENTLVLSRRKEAKPELLDLGVWLPKFITDYMTSEPNREIKIDFDQLTDEVMIKVDPTHLSQVMTNLCDNAIRYSEKTIGLPEIAICTGISDNGGTPFIDVIDEGPGVPENKLNQIFDPFYTTDEKGTGLGLYISKELCEINQAILHHYKNDENKSCFRINFSHHQRMI